MLRRDVYVQGISQKLICFVRCMQAYRKYVCVGVLSSQIIPHPFIIIFSSFIFYILIYFPFIHSLTFLPLCLKRGCTCTQQLTPVHVATDSPSSHK